MRSPYFVRWKSLVLRAILREMNAVVDNSEAAILARLVSPENADLSRDAANSILQIKFPAEDIERMNMLAAKARDGALASDEEAELDSYRHVGRLLEVLKSKARLSLKAAA